MSSSFEQRLARLDARAAAHEHAVSGERLSLSAEAPPPPPLSGSDEDHALRRARAYKESRQLTGALRTVLSAVKRTADVKEAEVLLTRKNLLGDDAEQRLGHAEFHALSEHADHIAINSELYAPLLAAGIESEQLVEYARFLLLKVFYHDVEGPHLLMSPSGPVDTVWHAHMLLPQDYVGACYGLLLLLPNSRPRVFFHDPATAADANRLERYAFTKNQYRKMFGRDAPSRWWPNERYGTPASWAAANQIAVKTLTGKTVLIDFDDRNMTFEGLASRIQNKEGIPPDQQRLIFQGQGYTGPWTSHCGDGGDEAVHHEATWHVHLADVGIVPGSVIHLVLRLRGC